MKRTTYIKIICGFYLLMAITLTLSIVLGKLYIWQKVASVLGLALCSFGFWYNLEKLVED